MRTALALSEKDALRRNDTKKRLELGKGLRNEQARKCKDRNKPVKNSEEHGTTGSTYLLMALKARVRHLDSIL